MGSAKEENVILKKSYDFALQVVKIYKFLTIERKEFVLSKQLLRSGTSIGANVEEAIAASSKADFIHKLTISAKRQEKLLTGCACLKTVSIFLMLPFYQFMKRVW